MRRSRAVLQWLALVAVAVTTLSISPDWAEAQAPDREFTIAVGETLTFNARSVRRVTVGLSDVADVKRTQDGRQLILVGKSRGVTTINIYSRDDQRTLLVRVVGVNPTSLAKECREILGEGSGVDVRVVKGRVLLEGEVASETFKKKIKKLTDLYPRQVLNFTTFREAFVEGAKMVAVDVYFVQLAVTNSDNMGVSWGQFLGGNVTAGMGDTPLFYETEDLETGVLPGMESQDVVSRPGALTGGDSITSYWSLIGNLNVTLDFLSEHGLIKTIQHGMIVTEGGKEAEYHTGGTLLIKLQSLGGAKLEKIPYGLNVKVKPVIDYQNQVKLELDAEISQLDYSNSIGEIPSLTDTHIATTVNMKHGQSVLVTSQDNTQNTSNRRGWWMISRIPILGWLFKSRNYLARSLDNALFVTPKIYEAGSQKHDAMVEGVFENLLDAGAEPEELPELSSATSASSSSSSAGGSQAPTGSAGDEGGDESDSNSETDLMESDQ